VLHDTAETLDVFVVGLLDERVHADLPDRCPYSKIVTRLASAFESHGVRWHWNAIHDRDIFGETVGPRAIGNESVFWRKS
jgi:hypothetical protein